MCWTPLLSVNAALAYSFVGEKLVQADYLLRDLKCCFRRIPIDLS